MSRQQHEFIKPLRFREELLAEEVPAHEHAGEGILHLKDLIPRLLARWHWIALGLVLGLGIGMYQVWRAIPLFQSKATILVRDYNVSVMGKLEEETEFDLRNTQAIETVRAQLLAFELVESIAGDSDVRDLPGLIPPKPKNVPFLSGAPESLVPPAPQLASMLQYWVEIKVQPKSRLIDIVVQHPKPQVAEALANEYVSHYIDQRSKSRSDEQTGDYDYLVEESRRVKDLLQQAQNLLASYTAPLEAEKALAAAETNVKTLALRFRHKHPQMIEGQAGLAQSQEHLRNLLTRAVRNDFDEKYWRDHSDSTADLTNLENLNRVRDLLISRRAVLESEIGSQNSLFTTILAQMESRGVTKEKTEAEVSPMTAARVNNRPVYPRKTRMIVQATALGLFAGLGLAFLFQYLDNKFHTVADVEHQLKIPVLAAVIDLDAAGATKAEPRNKKGEVTACSPGRERWDPHLVFKVEGASSHYAEMFRVLRTSISLLGPADQRKITMISSALPSEGKTIIAANLALALAQQGLRTILIDFDLRKPSVHKVFGLARDEQPGLVDLLAGNAAFEQVICTHTGQDNLSLILSGAKAPNPGELLEASRVEGLLKIFRSHYDHVVLDTAPLLAVPDSRIIAPLADNLGLVVRAESTPRGAVKRALHILDDFNVTPEGIIFNGYQERRSLIGKNYSYGYYQYGKYGKSGYGKYQYGSYGSVYGEKEEES